VKVDEGQEAVETSHPFSGPVFPLIDPMMFFQMNMSADIDPGGFHIVASKGIHSSTFEIMLEISNKWSAFDGTMLQYILRVT
jgi:hypothetical protein